MFVKSETQGRKVSPHPQDKFNASNRPEGQLTQYGVPPLPNHSLIWRWTQRSFRKDTDLFHQALQSQNIRL